MAPPAVVVVIVNYGTAELAAAAARSALASRGLPGPVAVEVVDNASPGGDAERLAGSLPEGARLRAEPVNHGFGGGNNAVLEPLLAQQDAPEFVFLLNPDAEVEPDTLATLRAFMERHPRAGFAGSAIRQPDGRHATAAFRFPTLVSEFAEAVNLGPVSRLCRRWQVSLPTGGTARPVGWVPGAAVMIRLAALREAGAFDPEFFLYHEETELMRRAARFGWETWYVPDAMTVHREGAATGVDAGEGLRRRRPAYWYESWRRYHVVVNGRAYAIACALARLAGSAINAGVRRVQGRPADCPEGFFPAFWRHALRPLLAGREAAARTSHSGHAARA